MSKLSAPMETAPITRYQPLSERSEPVLQSNRREGMIARTNIPAGKDAPVIEILKDHHVEAVVAAAEESHAPRTLELYRWAWKAFEAWCLAEGYQAFPTAPETVAAYMTERADKVSVAALKLDRAAIRYEHEKGGLDSPTTSEGVAKVLRGLTRRAADIAPKQATGITAAHLGAIKATAYHRRSGPTGRTESEEAAKKRGAVDIALITVMRDALLRRSEVVALRWGDISFKPDGSGRLTIRRSKTDQEGDGAVQYIGPETVEALEAIRGEDVDDSQLVFGISGRTVANRIKAAAKAAGLKGNFSGHSPRVGMAQDLAAHGASTTSLMVAGRWKAHRMPAAYTREQAAARGAVARFYGE